MYETAMAINACDPDAPLLLKYEAVMATARLTKASGSMLEAMTSQKESAKIRKIVQAELKELRGHLGKGQAEKGLLPVLKEKAERVLEGS